MKFLKPYSLNLIPYTLTLLLLSCAQSADPRPAFVSEPPSSLVALGLTLSAYVTLSTDPEKQQPLTLDPETNNFTGEVKAPMNETFDLTVVYTADDPTSGETVSLAHYIRRGLTATGPSMKVAYEGDESNWEASFDLAPGKSNELNLDGDPYDNFIEVGYRSDPTDPSSLPSGPIAAGTHEDPIFGPDVSLPPPGSGETSALHGDEEVTIEALTPFDLQKMEVVSPTFGFEVLSTDLTEKTMTILLHTKRFVIGKGQIDLVVRATDKFGLTHDTTLTAAVSNPVDDLAPLPLQLGLTDGSVVKDSASFVWELDDPSGIKADSVRIRVLAGNGTELRLIFPSDGDASSTRFRSDVSLDVTSLPDGTYSLVFEAQDGALNQYSDRRTIQVANTSPVRPSVCGDGTRSATEECDDGNLAGNDGCDASCRIEQARIVIETPGEGEKLRDIASVRATASSLFGRGLVFFGITDHPEIADQDGFTGTFVGGWDVRSAQLEDKEASIKFEARDIDGRITEVIRKVVVDNVPNISSFLANGSGDILIQLGDPVTLSWGVTNSTSVSIDNGLGAFDPAGSHTFNPPGGINDYTLTATRTNSLGSGQSSFSASKSVRVRVNRNPVFGSHLTVPIVAERPDEVVLSWTSSDPDGDPLTEEVAFYKSVDCRDPDRTIQSASPVTVSNLNPRTDYSYTVTLTDGNGGSATSECFNLTTTDTGLVGWWRFDEGIGLTASNSSGGGNNGTLYGPAWGVGVTGEDSDGSLDFDGSNDYLEIPDADPFDVGTGNFTVSAWVYSESTGSDQYIAEKMNGSQTNGFLLYRHSVGSVSFYVGECGSVASAPISTGQWAEVTGVRRGDQFYLYINGRLGAAGSCANVNINNDGPLVVGWGRDHHPSNPFVGEIDEVSVYNRALSVDEIRQSCRRNDPTGVCPAAREPIILTPLPNQALPPTRAYWSWRGERGRDGNLVNPGLTYTVTFDIDRNVPPDGSFGGPLDSRDNGIAADPGIQQTGNVWYYVESRPDYIDPSLGYQIHVTPNQGPESTRIFSTDNSAVAWWKLDDDINYPNPEDPGHFLADDSILGGPNVGTLINGPAWWTTGLLGHAVSFDGVNDYIDITLSGVEGSPLDLTNAFSMTAWVNPGDYNNEGDEWQIVTKSGVTSATGYGLSLQVRQGVYSSLNFYAGYSGEGAPACTVNQSMTPGSWSFVGGSRYLGGSGPSGYLASCYLDAASNTVTARVLDANTETLKLARGSASGIPSYYFGLMDEVIIYNRGLTDSDMCNSYLAFCLSSDLNLPCDTSCVGDE